MVSHLNPQYMYPHSPIHVFPIHVSPIHVFSIYMDPMINVSAIHVSMR